MMAPGAFGAPPAPAPTLSAEQVLAALQEVDAILLDPAALAQITAARAAAGTDAMMAMMMVLSLAAQLLAPVLTKYGFAGDQSGLFQFVAAGFAHSGHEEITRLASSMRERVVPPELLPMITGMVQMQVAAAAAAKPAP